MLRNIDPVAKEEETVNINQQIVKMEEERTEELPPGITLDGADLTPEQTEKLHRFLLKWKNIFSTGVTD